MLFALLYNSSDEIVAAAYACDQLVLGDDYWTQTHPVDVDPSDCQTAYVNVIHPLLQYQLTMLGIDENLDPKEITNWVESAVAPEYRQTYVA